MTLSGADSPPSAPTPPPSAARVRLVRSLWLALFVVVVALAWVVVTGWRARADLEALRHDVSRLRSDLVAGNVAAARQELAQAQAKAAAAHARTTGPAWWVGAKLPGLGTPLRTVRGIAAVGHELSRTALPAVVAGGVALDPQQLRIGPNRIDLARLQQAAPPLGRALPALRSSTAEVAGLPGSWLGPVSSGRRSLLTQLTSLEGTVHDTVTATRLMPTMLGGAGRRTYLVVFEGDNEARGVGGIFGGFGLLHADKGRLRFRRFGGDQELHGVRAQVNLGRQFETAYSGANAYESSADAGISPHFPDAAKIWSSMVSQRLGVRIDGVVAMDPVALARILAVVGPVRTPDGTLLTSANLVRTLDVGVYRRFDSGTEAVDTPARKAFFVSAAQAVTQAALHRSIQTIHMLHALGRSAGQHQLVAYSATPGEEAQLAATPLGGTLSGTRAPFAEVVVNNDSATKLDYFLHRSLVYQRSTCAATTATVTVRLHNAAPSSGLPAYMTQGAAWGDVAHPPGTEKLIVYFYSTHGSSVAGVTLDGQPLGAYGAQDAGHPLTETVVVIKPGQTRTMVFRVNEPAATGPVELPVQPLPQPMTVRAAAPTC